MVRDYQFWPPQMSSDRTTIGLHDRQMTLGELVAEPGLALESRPAKTAGGKAKTLPTHQPPEVGQINPPKWANNLAKRIERIELMR